MLRVLDRPEIPLHTNGSERDICLHVSPSERSVVALAAPMDCRDAFLGLMRTAAKVGIAFWDYLGGRLSIPDQPIVAYLPGHVSCRRNTA